MKAIFTGFLQIWPGSACILIDLFLLRMPLGNLSLPTTPQMVERYKATSLSDLAGRTRRGRGELHCWNTQPFSELVTVSRILMSLTDVKQISEFRQNWASFYNQQQPMLKMEMLFCICWIYFVIYHALILLLSCRCWFSTENNQLVYTKSHKVGADFSPVSLNYLQMILFY